MGREISKEEETGTGIEGGSPARSRGAGCRGELFSSGVLARSIRDEHGDGPGFGIVSCILSDSPFSRPNSRMCIYVPFSIQRAPGGELQMILDRDEVPEERQVARLLKQILGGIAFLHSLNVAHLDIKVSVEIYSMLTRKLLRYIGCPRFFQPNFENFVRMSFETV